MSHDMEKLVRLLKSNPGHVYVNPEGTHLFALVGPEEELMVAMSPPNFKEMSDAEIQAFVRNCMT